MIRQTSIRRLQDALFSLPAVVEPVTASDSMYHQSLGAGSRYFFPISPYSTQSSPVLSLESSFRCGHPPKRRSGLAQDPSGEAVVGKQPDRAEWSE